MIKGEFEIKKIGVIGPGIVGMPMAAMLADAQIRIGTDQPAKVVVVQRNSENSGWKVNTINQGKSVIGGIEPELDNIVNNAVKKNLLSATHDYNELADADVILVCVQTDKKGFEPDYGPLFGALNELGTALQKKNENHQPIIIFESTLAPTTMDTVIRDQFKKFGLEEGKDIFLGNSPNRVMPGRLVERIRESDKLAGGLHPDTPDKIEMIYKHIVTKGEIFKTNSLTAEIVKTLENAYRDVRIAFSAEIARFCDDNNIDFYKVRELVNEQLSQQDEASEDPNAVPRGGILIPTLGVGGHCLPKDGILLWWRNIETGIDTSQSLILGSREINDESPVYTLNQVEKAFGSLKNKRIALLGVAYRFNSEDTRNSPTLVLADHLKNNGYDFIMQDPYVKSDDQNLTKYNLNEAFTNDLEEALSGADILIMACAHKDYIDHFQSRIVSDQLEGIMDACNIYTRQQILRNGINYTGIGRGTTEPESAFVDFVMKSFNAMERGLAVELEGLINFYNSNYAYDEFNEVEFNVVQDLAKTCSTGCEIADPNQPSKIHEYQGFVSRLASLAVSKSNN